MVDVYECKLFETFENAFDPVFWQVLAMSQLQFLQHCGGLANFGYTRVINHLQTIKFGDL